jgi:septal ring factor EnvC (AmiA/AmiB activator)
VDLYLFSCLALIIAYAVLKAQTSRRLQNRRDEWAEVQTEVQKTSGQRRQLEASLEHWRSQESEVAAECRKLTEERDEAASQAQRLEASECEIRTGREPETG